MLSWIDDETPLPAAHCALGPESDAPGLVAAGGTVTPARLEEAYRKGIFPWFSPGQPALWWSPDPRMVLPVAQFKLYRSLRKAIAAFLTTPGCEVRIDTNFAAVIAACATTPREGQGGTWILAEMQAAYIALQQAGLAHSIETWAGGKLVGGLYCTAIGGAVFGESMFAHQTDASKIALAALVALCRAQGVPLIDCQQNTAHLASLGACEMPREEFCSAVNAGAAKMPIQWLRESIEWKLLDARLAPHTVF